MGKGGKAVGGRAAPNLEVERTVDAVLLCSEDGRQMFRHGVRLVCAPAQRNAFARSLTEHSTQLLAKQMA